MIDDVQLGLIVDQGDVRSGSNSEVRMLNREVGFALNNGHRQPSLSGPKSAKGGSRCSVRSLVATAATIIRVVRLAAILLRIAQDLRRADKGQLRS
jgi:hypothetical protein